MNEKGVSQVPKKTTAEEYLANERNSSTRNEFINGRVIPRSNSNRWHNLIVTNATIAIGSRLQGHKCDVYVSSMRVKLQNNVICYPDLILVNGEPSFTDQKLDLLQNPTVVVEIFSAKTESSDKSEKMESYLAMDSIKECLMVKEDGMRVEHYARQNAKQWVYRIYNERDDVISLESVQCKVSLSEIYSQIKFGSAEISSTAVN
jgi:Uma2 family endonuclease